MVDWRASSAAFAGALAIKIAVIGHIRHPIAPPFMGGMESHSHSLVRALEQAGHEVVLFAAGQSDLSCFTSICERPYEDVLPWADWRGTERLAQYQQRAFTTAWNVIVQSDFDVVHNNSLYPDLIDWARRDDVPMLTSQHVPPYAMMRDAVDNAASSNSQQFSVTSNSQLRLWNPPGHTAHPNLRIVYNGVDLSSWQPAKKRSDRMLWFGRITPNKGLREAVAAALRAGIAMDIVGVIEDEQYFAEHVQPHLSEQIAYRGHMTGEALRKAVCHARAVVVTPMWDEPFGLVAAEAMACDVPVIAFDRGAMREVLGDCGTLVPAGDVEALAHAMACLDSGRQSGIRARALGVFSLEAMVAGYESAYAAAIAGAASASSISRTEALLA